MKRLKRTNGFHALLLSSCLAGAPAYAMTEKVPGSLFLTPGERTAPLDASMAVTRLDALVYYAPENWKIWLNGRIITPSTPETGLTVLTVTPDTVTLRQSLGGQTRSFTLAPHQSYDWGQDKVTETR